VAKVRRLTGVRRIGHTGTLDPLATGVLVLCLGQATRVVEYMIGHDKRYRAAIRLGIDTDSYDAQGHMTAQHPVEVSETALRKTLEAFVGDVEQIPPMFSAIKRGGQKLVDLARKGVEVEREPRRVTIYSIDLIDFKSPDVTIDVHCSAGTYIRSLAHDVGRALGCGAHLSALTRSAVGDFRLDHAVTIEAFQAAVEDGSWQTLLRPLDAALSRFPSATISAQDAARARNGAAVSPPRDVPANVEADLIRVYDPAGRMVGLMRLDGARSELQPVKIFA
jgi:tRNA pseudouridine55 synthase